MSSIIHVSYTPLMEYAAAWDKQKELVQAVDTGDGGEQLLLLQHPPTYTIGSQRHPEHLLWSEEELKERGIALFQIDRGGDITYHGPGQLVGYPILLLDTSRGMDPHRYLRTLEQVIIDYLAEQGIEAGRKEAYTGVWVGDLKIAAIGIKFNKCRSRRGFITSHGFAFNIASGIEQQGFSGIIPCGIEEYGVTSLEDITGRAYDIRQVANEIVPHFARHFGYEQPEWGTTLTEKAEQE